MHLTTVSSTVAQNTAKSSLDALKAHSWKPGQSGNPGGRPKQHFSFVDYLRDWLQGKDVGGETKLEVCLMNLKENKPEVLLNYAYGKPIEHIKLEASDNPMAEIAIQVARLIVAQQVEKLATIEVKQIESTTQQTNDKNDMR